MGIKVNQSNGKIALSQEQYLDKVLKKFKMQDCKPVKTPLEPGLKLSKSENCEVDN